ncbi:Methylamine utilization protein MauE [compost metagenome]
MDSLALGFRLLVAVMFLTSFLEKIRNYNLHLFILKDYKIIPHKLVNLFGALDVIAQILIALSFILGVWIYAGYVTSSILLFTYAIAISINLLRGRNNISCGCGGLVGNHQISWWLVFRNLLIVSMLILLCYLPNELGNSYYIFVGEYNRAYNITYFFTLIVTISILVFFYISKQLWTYYKKITNHILNLR